MNRSFAFALGLVGLLQASDCGAQEQQSFKTLVGKGFEIMVEGNEGGVFEVVGQVGDHGVGVAPEFDGELRSDCRDGSLEAPDAIFVIFEDVDH